MAKRVKARKTSAAKKAQMRRLDESKKAMGLERYVRELGFDVKNLDIRYEDGVATISGTVPDQDTREKVILAVGNVADVGTVDEELTVSTPSEESDLHVVESGDTLSAIAKTHYGDANKYMAIFEANRPMLSDPDKIYIGQVLRIPASA